MSKKAVPTYEAIVFDFGNIFLDLDFDGCFKSFQNLLGIPFTMESMPPSILHAIKEHQKGLLTNRGLFLAFKKIAKHTSYDGFRKSWNSLLISIPVQRIQFIKEVSKKYKIFLLSNINNFHEDWIDNYCDEVFGIKDFKNQFFDGFYYSHYMGMCKPNEDIYATVQKDLLSKGISSFLFIDDMQENIDAARQCGWKAVKHDPRFDIVDRFGRYLKTK